MSGRYLRPVIAMLAVLSISDTQGHEHVGPGGAVSWYPQECCHDGDCRPVAQIKRAPHGLWLTTEDGMTILIGPADPRRPSKDSRWHVCVTPDIELTTDRILCIFEPANS